MVKLCARQTCIRAMFVHTTPFVHDTLCAFVLGCQTSTVWISFYDFCVLREWFNECEQ